MTRTRAAVVLAVTAAVVLVCVALAHHDPSGFAYKWYWTSGGVGNFTDDAVLATLGGWKLAKEWRAHRAHQAKILEHLDVLHRHHGIGKYADRGSSDH